MINSHLHSSVSRVGTSTLKSTFLLCLLHFSRLQNTGVSKKDEKGFLVWVWLCVFSLVVWLVLGALFVDFFFPKEKLCINLNNYRSKNPLPFSRTGSGQAISPCCTLEDLCGRELTWQGTLCSSSRWLHSHYAHNLFLHSVHQTKIILHVLSL